MNQKNTHTLRIIMLLVITILLNILFNRFSFRLDFTEDKRYTLNEATINILKNLEDPVTVTAYVSEDIHPQINEKRSEFKDLLVEFENRSKGKILYQFVDPNENDDNKEEATKKGITPATIQVRERDQFSQKIAFIGALVQKGENSKTIPYLLADGYSMEYLLISTIKSISLNQKPKVGFIQGHGEPSVEYYNQVKNALSGFYKLENVSLNNTNLDGYASLVISNPTDSFSKKEFDILDKLLSKGKSILITCNKNTFDFITQSPKTINTGIDSWLAKKSIIINNDYVVDQKHSRLQLNIFQSTPFAYYPVLTNFGKHIITEGLETVNMEFTSSVTFLDSTNTFTPLIRSSNRSATLPNFRWDGTNKFSYNKSNITVGGILERQIEGNFNSSIIIFTDGKFGINGIGRTAKKLAADNVSLIVNSIDYISGKTLLSLNHLRTREITSRPIKLDLEDSIKTLIKYTNFLLPIFLIIIYGIIRLQLRNKKRQHWLEEDYS